MKAAAPYRRGQAHSQECATQESTITIREALRRNFRERLTTGTNPSMAVVQEPDGEHPRVQLIHNPAGDSFALGVKVVPKDPEGPVCERANMNDGVGCGPARDRSYLKPRELRRQLPQEIGLERRIV